MVKPQLVLLVALLVSACVVSASAVRLPDGGEVTKLAHQLKVQEAGHSVESSLLEARRELINAEVNVGNAEASLEKPISPVVEYAPEAQQSKHAEVTAVAEHSTNSVEYMGEEKAEPQAVDEHKVVDAEMIEVQASHVKERPTLHSHAWKKFDEAYYSEGQLKADEMKEKSALLQEQATEYVEASAHVDNAVVDLSKPVVSKQEGGDMEAQYVEDLNAPEPGSMKATLVDALGNVQKADDGMVDAVFSDKDLDRLAQKEGSALAQKAAAPASLLEESEQVSNPAGVLPNKADREQELQEKFDDLWKAQQSRDKAWVDASMVPAPVPHEDPSTEQTPPKDYLEFQPGIRTFGQTYDKKKENKPYVQLYKSWDTVSSQTAVQNWRRYLSKADMANLPKGMWTKKSLAAVIKGLPHYMRNHMDMNSVNYNVPGNVLTHDMKMLKQKIQLLPTEFKPSVKDLNFPPRVGAFAPEYVDHPFHHKATDVEAVQEYEKKVFVSKDDGIYYGPQDKFNPLSTKPYNPSKDKQKVKIVVPLNKINPPVNYKFVPFAAPAKDLHTFTPFELNPDTYLPHAAKIVGKAVPQASPFKSDKVRMPAPVPKTHLHIYKTIHSNDVVLVPGMKKVANAVASTIAIPQIKVATVSTVSPKLKKMMLEQEAITSKAKVEGEQAAESIASIDHASALVDELNSKIDSAVHATEEEHEEAQEHTEGDGQVQELEENPRDKVLESQINAMDQVLNTMQTQLHEF